MPPVPPYYMQNGIDGLLWSDQTDRPTVGQYQAISHTFTFDIAVGWLNYVYYQMSIAIYLLIDANHLVIPPEVG